MKLISSFFRIPVIDNFIRLKLIPYFIWLYLHIVHKTSKVIYFNKKYYDDLANENIRHTFAVWHGRQFTSLYLHRNKGIIVLVSPSRDGNVQAAFLELFGFGVVRGSSDKQPVKSLLELIRISKKKQVDV
ncbi:MAG TPA: DUF374 domain-containing protein, partial [bacterium]|nr:DUF374 domain-containing protein [bacterium]